MTEIVNGLLLRDQEVLLARRSPMRLNYPGTWSFPGGHVEDGESHEQALKRELSEEIGISAECWSFMQRFIDVAANPERNVMFHFFRVDEWTGEPTNLCREHTEIRWVQLDDAMQLKGLTFPIYIELIRALKG